ncbi:MAG: sigma-70 family RNA polymerase sigma factor [Alphaproteobacteria bacterium]|nr:sigma-70 family RNA polymerase sigma factor [Alphaproteobacteria bacterium]
MHRTPSIPAAAIDASPPFVMIAQAVIERLWAFVQQDDETSEAPSARWQRLMTAAQTGDKRAYASFLKEAAAFIRVIARRYHRDAGAIEDVVQETLLTLHRIRETYEPGRPVEPWVGAVAKARAIDALRARTRRAAIETETTDATQDVADTATAADAQHETRAEIAAALAALPAGQRAAVRMLKIEELSLAEAAVQSGQSVPALKSLLHRAMLSLRVALTGGRDA